MAHIFNSVILLNMLKVSKIADFLGIAKSTKN